MATNEELVRASYAAFRRGDIDAAMAVFAADIRWTHPDGLNDYGLGGTKRGHHEVRAFMARARSLLSEIRPQPDEFVISGDRIAVFGVHHMRGARSGVAATFPFVHSWRFKDGLATHFEDIHDTAPVRAILASKTDADRVGHIQRLGMDAFMSAKVLHSAIEIGVFTELARRPLCAEDLRLRLGLHERGARDFFDALVTLGLLDRHEGVYANTAATATYLGDAGADTYLGGFLEYAGSQWYRSWGKLTDALRTGRSQTHDGDGAFEAIYADPELTERFQRAMTGGSLAAAIALPEAFPWRDHRTVVDVGCSDGPLLARLLRAHPHLTGIGVDLPPVAPAFQKTAVRYGVADRMTFTPGDFLAGPLPSADVLILGHVLLDWDLENRRALLAKAYDALPKGGVVLIYDMLIDDERRQNVTSLLLSLHMIVDYRGGSTYTAADCLGWLTDAGFRDCRVKPLAGPEYLIAAIK
jgi:ketosteroid isomerase-like protein/SAM-dependent methyltransferase